MIINYEDISLRAIEEEDLDLLREMINDPVIDEMTGGSSLPVSKREHQNWFNNLTNKDVRLIIDTKEYGAIGIVMLTDIDYRNSTAQFHSKIATSKNIRGKGFGTKATYALVKYAFDYLNLNCIYSFIIEYNIASQRVKEKCGFKKDGVLRHRIYKNGNYYNLTAWSVEKDDFRALEK